MCRQCLVNSTKNTNYWVSAPKIVRKKVMDVFTIFKNYKNKLYQNVFFLYYFRCGALHPGDQLLAFDDHVIDGNNYTAEEVMCYLENCESGFTRIHIAPRHVLAHGGRYSRGNITPLF